MHQGCLRCSGVVTLEGVARPESGCRLNPLLVGGVILLAIAAALLLVYRFSGSHVDGDGWLQEPFACIPLAWFSGVSGLILVVMAAWRGRR